MPFQYNGHLQPGGLHHQQQLPPQQQQQQQQPHHQFPPQQPLYQRNQQLQQQQQQLFNQMPLVQGRSSSSGHSSPSMSTADTKTSVLETKYFLTRQGPLGTPGQANAAASFFAKAHQKLQQHQQQQQQQNAIPGSPGSRGQRRRRAGQQDDSSEERDQFPTNFRMLVQRFPTQIPSGILKKLESSNMEQQQLTSLGKIRVIVRVTRPSSAAFAYGSGLDENHPHHRHFQLDQKRRQVTLYDPALFRGTQGDLAPEERKIGVAAPKMFAFDGLFTSEDSQEDVCCVALPDVVQAVLNGNDGCLFCFGHANLGKTRTMLGSDQCAKDMGAIPIAITWLYRAIKERKAKQGARFSVRVTALEITSQREEIRDLLAPYATDQDQSPGVYLNPGSSSGGSCLQNLSELRASSAEKAAYYLDAALAARSLDSQGRESHLIFTLHVYQYSENPQGKGGMAGGRSRLHLVDFGGCERTKIPGSGITLSGLGNVILGIFNGQKHLPHRDSKVTQVLRECLGSLTCQATMLAHVSPEPSHYSETLHTVQLASRLHRMRRKRLKANSSSNSNSSDDHRRLSKFRSHRSGSGRSGSSGKSSSDLTSTNCSSSEMSCDTVVYRGQSDGSGTDSEHPPSVYLPANLRLLGSSNGGSAPGSLRGSFDDIPRRRKILTNGAISPRRNLSPQPLAQQQALLQHQQQMLRSPNRSLSSLPVIHEVHTNSRRMPLNGLVPVPGRRATVTPQQQEQWIDANPNYRRVQRSSPNLKPKNASNLLYSTHKQQQSEIWVDGNHSPAMTAAEDIVQQQQQQQQLPEQPEIFQHLIQKTQNNLNNNNNSSNSNQKQSSVRKYGYMDEHKVNMISNWVEKQTLAEREQQQKQQQQQQQQAAVIQEEQQQELRSIQQQSPVFHVLTQFKTCDSDESSSLGKQQQQQQGQTEAAVEAAVEQQQIQVTVHAEEEDISVKAAASNPGNAAAAGSSRKCPPPPPPRRTPPREFAAVAESKTQALSAVEESENNINSLMDECNKIVATLSGSNLNNNNSPTDLEERTLREVSPPGQEPQDEKEHPLRILSEENLTVVSSFGGSLNDLDCGGRRCDELLEDEEEDEDHPTSSSKLSFFQVPDFASIKVDMEAQDNFISQRFREFAQLEKRLEDKRREERDREESYFRDPRFEDTKKREEALQTFSSQNKNTKSEEQQPQSLPAVLNHHPRQLQQQQLKQQLPMTPQKQFQLLAQSLRHPDGSSNPELNEILVSKEQQLQQQQQQQRSPGNGRSSSDIEREDLANKNEPSCHWPAAPDSSNNTGAAATTANNNQNTTVASNVVNNNKMLHQVSRSESPASQGKQQQQQQSNNNNINNNHNNEATTAAPSKKESSRFGFRFLRIFGSTRKLNKNKGENGGNSSTADLPSSSRRSKSCEGRSKGAVVAAGPTAAAVSSQISSAASISDWSNPKLLNFGQRNRSSPNVNHHNSSRQLQQQQQQHALDTPSMLSLATTEWEYQHEEEAPPPEEDELDNSHAHNSLRFLQIPSLSSLNPKLKAPDRKSSGYDSLGGESSSLDSNQETEDLKSRMAKAAAAGSEPPSSHDAEIPYSTPNDEYSKESIEDGKDIELIQYDELDILRMEHRLKQIYD